MGAGRARASPAQSGQGNKLPWWGCIWDVLLLFAGLVDLASLLPFVSYTLASHSG